MRKMSLRSQQQNSCLYAETSFSQNVLGIRRTSKLFVNSTTFLTTLYNLGFLFWTGSSTLVDLSGRCVLCQTSPLIFRIWVRRLEVLVTEQSGLLSHYNIFCCQKNEGEIFESRCEAEEVGFEPTARNNSSIAVRGRPRRAQKAHGASTEIHRYTLSFAGSAVKKSLPM
jgi:hypothetical protein